MNWRVYQRGKAGAVFNSLQAVAQEAAAESDKLGDTLRISCFVSRKPPEENPLMGAPMLLSPLRQL